MTKKTKPFRSIAKKDHKKSENTNLERKKQDFVSSADRSNLDPAANRTRVMTIKINQYEYELIELISNKRMSKKSSMVKQLIAEEARRLGLND